MPSKKKKYNARFPAGRIKKIMQSDEEVGKVAQAVPIIISRTLELFVESLLTKTLKITYSRNAKTLSTSHMKQCIMSEQRFDFLRELVRNIPDISVAEEAANYNEEDNQSSPEEQYADSDTPYDLSMPSTSSIRCSSTNTNIRSQHHPTTTNGQNGGGGSGVISEHHKNYLKRSMSSNPNSVIMHTMSLPSAGSFSSTEHLPPKLSRSESNPVPATPPQVLRRNDVLPPRLKHQSYSMPSNNIDLTTNNSNKPNIHPKALRTPSQQINAAAIPAPIVSIDYCSKPVVKIDYSNLPLATATATAPLSAPAHIASMAGVNNSAFNFNTEPVINIDLSNIVAAAGASSTSTSTTPVATISIGSPLRDTHQQSINSKASEMAEPSYNSLSSLNTTTTKAPNIATMTPTSATVPNSGCGEGTSSLELDEDYDNI